MLQKTKIKIVIGVVSSVVLFGVLFYFQKSLGSKKVELNLAQSSEAQKNIEEEANNQAETSATLENTANIIEDKNAISQPIEGQKEALVIEKPETKVVEETAKVSKLSITNRLTSWGFQKAESRKIDTIIIHSSYDALGDDPYSVSGVIAEYKEYEVAPHYLIDRKGKAHRLVEDKNIAYHAGESVMPDGRKGVNAFSIGIEMLTTKKDKLTDAQYSALKLLIADLKVKYKIGAVLGHNQIAPGRKDDPWNFEWGKLK